MTIKYFENKRNKARRQTILVLAILFITSILAINLVSAGLINGLTSTYKKDITTNKYGEITLKETFLGIPTGDYAKYVLDYNTDFCLTNCYAEGMVDLYKEGVIFSDLTFKDRTNKYVIPKSSKIYIYVDEEYITTDYIYEDKCKLIEELDKDLNVIAKSCSPMLLDTKKITNTRKVLKEYKGEEVKAGVYKWRIEGTKNFRESIDWIAEVDNQKLTQWAWWNASFRLCQNFTMEGWTQAENSIPLYKEFNQTLMRYVNATTGKNVAFVNSSCSNDGTSMPFEVDFVNSTTVGYWILGNITTSNQTWSIYIDKSNDTNYEQPTFWSSINYLVVVHGNNISTNVKNSVTNQNGTMSSTSIVSTTENAFAGRGWYFNANGYINFTNDGSFNKAFWTMESYHKYNATGEPGGLPVVMPYTTSWSAPYGSFFNRGTGTSDSYVNYNNAGTYTQYLAGQSLTTVGSWVQVYNGTGSFTFKNGIVSATTGASGSGSTYSGNPNFIIASRVPVGNNLFVGWIDEIRFSNGSRSPSWINRSYYNYVWKEAILVGEVTELFENTPPTVTLNSPANAFVTNNPSITFNCSATMNTGSTGVTNLTLFVGANRYSVYNTSSNQNLSLQTAFTLADGNHTWNCSAIDNIGQTNSTSRTLTVDSIKPSVTIDYPTANLIKLNKENDELNFTITDTATNITGCWYNLDNGVNKTIAGICNSSLTLSGTTLFNVTNGNHTIYLYANDTANNVGSNNVSFFYYNFTHSGNTTMYENTYQSFILTINATDINTLYSNSNATLNLGGNKYVGVANRTDTQYLIFNTTVLITSSMTNATGKATDYNWTFNLKNTSGDSLHSATTGNILANLTDISLTLCSATNKVPFINFTFKNETVALETVSAAISGTVYYWIENEANKKTFTYSNTSYNPSYAFCFSPSDRTVNIEGAYYYSNTESQQRVYTFDTTFTNTTTNTTLYLLPTSAGIYTTFQVISNAGEAISGALIVINRTGYGTQSQTTDAAGSSTFFLNPLAAYSIYVSKDGYTPYGISLTPTQTSYTITLGAISNVTQIDYARGISYYIEPTTVESLLNKTTYSFNLTVVSSYWNLDGFGFYMNNGTGNYGSNSSTTGTGGTLNLRLNTVENKTFIMNYYWIVNGTYQNGTATWSIYDVDGQQFSLYQFFTDLKNYMNQGIFGLTKFGFSLILFIVIFFIVGMASYKFGIISPAGISGILFATVALFDVGFGLISSSGTYTGLATFVSGLIFIVLTIREMSQ